MNKKLILFVVIPIVSISIIVLGCYFIFLMYKIFQIREAANRPLYPRRECLQLSEEDFIGTWYAGNPTHSETLIIQEGGIYKQLIHVENSYYYESDWQPWWLEYSPNGNFIHLDGMNLCAAFPNLENCENTGGVDFSWDNICGDNPSGISIPAKGEGILYAMKSPKLLLNWKQEIYLRPMYLRELPWNYELESP